MLHHTCISGSIVEVGVVNSGRYLVTPSSMAMLRSVIATARAIRVFGLGTLHQRHIVYSTDPVDEGIAFPSDDLFVTKGKGPVEIPRDQHTVLVIQPDTKQRENMAPMHKLEEAVSLVESISGWDVHETRIDNVRRPNNKHLFGTGKIAELQKVIRKLPISAVFVNTPALTPLQQTTLENMFEKTVFDRFSIVLKIFKERAQTKQAKVQVQLAEIPYLRSRLAQRFRQAGGNQQRGDSGKGEESPLQVQQLDLDKKEQNILQKLNEMRANRLVTRTQRKRVSLPVVALVGYTNAGKTTLAGALSKDESLQPKDMLFATLDTTLHAGLLPCGLKVLYMDTIGFISDLPHELVDSFAATLEEITLAVSNNCCNVYSSLSPLKDVMVHVRDASHPHAKAHSLNVHKVLTELKLKPDLHTNMIEVLNKCDKM